MMFRWLIVVAAAMMAAGSTPVWSQEESSAPDRASNASESSAAAPTDKAATDAAPAAEAVPAPVPEEPRPAETAAGAGGNAAKAEDNTAKAEDSPTKSDTGSSQPEAGNPASASNAPATGGGGTLEGIRQTLQTPQAVTPQMPDARAGHDPDPSSVWGRKISTYLAQHLRYPKGRSESQPVMVGVRIVVTPRGEVVTARVMKSSGDVQFDEAALDMVRRSNPLPPAPAAVTLEGSSFNVPVVFRPTGPVPSVSPIGNALALDLPVVADNVCDRTFSRLRAEAATRGIAIQTAMAVERTHPIMAPQRCRLFGDFAQAQLKILRFVQTNGARCGISAEQVWRVMEGYRDIQGLQTHVCTTGSGETASGRDGYALAYSTPISDDNGFDVAYGITAYRPSLGHRIGHSVSDTGHFPTADFAMRDGVAAPGGVGDDSSRTDIPTGAVGADAPSPGDSPANGGPAEPGPSATISPAVAPAPAAESDGNAASQAPAETAPAPSTVSHPAPAAPPAASRAPPHSTEPASSRASTHRAPRSSPPPAASARAGSTSARPAHARNPDRGGPTHDEARVGPPNVFTWGALPFWTPSAPPAPPPRPPANTPNRTAQPAPQPAPVSEGTYRWGSGPGPAPARLPE